MPDDTQGHKGPLWIVLERFADAFGFSERIQRGLEDRLENITGQENMQLEGILGRLNRGDRSASNDLLDWVFASPLNPWEKFVVAVMKWYMTVMMVVTGGLEPIRRTVSYRYERLIESRRFDPETALRISYRHPELRDEMLEHVHDYGLPSNLITALDDITRQRAPEDVLLTRWLRGDMPEAELDRELSARAWAPQAIEDLKAVRDLIPGVQDLIQMAVREAWRDDVAARFGYDEDFPTDVVPWAEKQGLGREWVERYWRAHWNLPGVRDMFEMFQRLRPGRSDHPFTPQDLETVLRVADIPAAFRTWLTEIAYQPLTRVDVRRMYGLGVKDEDGVYESYRDLGYNEDDARAMTEFTVKYESDEAASITRSSIQSGYEIGLFTRPEALLQLRAIGNPEQLAEFYLDQVDWQLAEQERKDELKYIETLYLAGEIDEAGLMAELGRLNMPATTMQRTYDTLYLKRRQQIKLPTKAELDRWLKMDIIDEAELVQGHRNLGYGADDTARYLAETLTEMQQAAAKEVERTQKEQERLYTAQIRSDYQITAADIDQEIAQVRLAIADIKVALLQELPDEQAEELVVRMVELRRYIVALQLEKAGTRLDYEELRAPGE